MYLVTSEQMSAFDKQTITQQKVPGIVLMDHAGRAVADEIVGLCPARTSRVVVLCGKGNNGGDGWVAARWLVHYGFNVQVVSMVDPTTLRGDAGLAANMALATGVPYVIYQSETTVPDGDLYVDALLGTGQNRSLSPELASLVEAVNARDGKKIAVDLPTGVQASTGMVAEPVFSADVTVTFQFQKLGTAVSPGCYHAGEVRVVDIGIRAENTDDCAVWVTPQLIHPWLPPRTNQAHKGTFGRLGIAVGQMAGAATLAGLGAARVGTGLIVLGVRGCRDLAVPPDFVVRHLCESRRHPDDGDSPFRDSIRLLADAAVGTGDEVLEGMGDLKHLVIGSGLGDEVPYWRALVANHQGTGVLDADGLKMLTGNNPVQLPSGKWVLTPHPKECSRLLGCKTEEIQENRLEAAKAAACLAQAVVVLKGYRSIVATPEGDIRVIPTGDASLATAGTGDILAGIIGGLLAQGLQPFDAAAAGAWIHGRAGELAGQARSKMSTMASDVVDNISRAILLHFDKFPGE